MQKETKASSAATMVTQVGKFDVLMGRGSFATDYEGNLRLRELVMERYDDYASTNRRCDKHNVAKEIVKIVLERGGRFLQSPTPDQHSLPTETKPWMVVTDKSILTTKVKQLLRDAGKETRDKAKGKDNGKCHKAAACIPSVVVSHSKQQSDSKKGAASSSSIARAEAKAEVVHSAAKLTSKELPDVAKANPPKVSFFRKGLWEGTPEERLGPHAFSAPRKLQMALSELESLQNTLALQAKAAGMPSPSIQSHVTAHQAQDEQNMLIYLALVAQVSQAPRNASTSINNNDVSNQLWTQQGSALPNRQAYTHPDDIIAQRVLENAVMERELEALARAQNFHPAGTNFPPTSGLYPTPPQDVFARQNLFQSQPQLPFGLPQNQPLELEELIHLQRLRELQQQQETQQALSFLASPPIYSALPSQPSTGPLNEELIIAEAIEQARIAQLLQSLR